MKKLLLLLFLLPAIFSEAQTSVYHPFPDSNWRWLDDKWCNPIACGDMGYCDSTSHSIEGDTIINSTIYHKIYSSGRHLPWMCGNPPCCGDTVYFSCAYEGAFRNDTIARKVFFMYATTSTEQLL